MNGHAFQPASPLKATHQQIGNNTFLLNQQPLHFHDSGGHSLMIPSTFYQHQQQQQQQQQQQLSHHHHHHTTLFLPNQSSAFAPTNFYHHHQQHSNASASASSLPIYYVASPPPASSMSAMACNSGGGSGGETLLNIDYSFVNAMQPTTIPCILMLKGAPASTTVADVLQFFNGYEVI